MEDLTSKITEVIPVIISILVAAQAVISYVLPPEKAEKFNWIGKVLNILSRTKTGLSPKAGNEKVPSSN